MMATSRFLNYEIALLLAKYGKPALLEALASKLQLTPDQLEEILQRGLDDKHSSQARQRRSPVGLVERLTQEYPNKAQFLRTLHGRFGNRSFLPDLRDVKRFFEDHDRPPGASKSRAETLPILLRLLADLDIAELEALCQAPTEHAYSSLSRKP